MSEEITASAVNYVSSHPGCSHKDLEGYLIFEKMLENDRISGAHSITSEDFEDIEHLADVLIG